MPNFLQQKPNSILLKARVLRNPLLVLMLLALFLPLLLAVMVQRQSTIQRAATIHQVIIKNYTMNPKNITINAGDAVTWTNQDSDAHDAAATDGSWSIPLLSTGESGTQTFLQPGTYEYWCTPHKGTMKGYTVTVLPAAAQQPIQTAASPTPTRAPTFIPLAPTLTSSPPTATPTVTPTPTPTLTPTPTPQAGSGTGPTSLSLTLLLHGLGNAGDNTNVNGELSNKNPKRTERLVRVTLINSAGQTVLEPTASVTYSPATGDFRGAVPLGTNFSAGTYTVKIKVDTYLQKIIARNFVITGGAINTVPAAQLIAGDVDGNNTLDSLDYNALLKCFNKDVTGSDCFADEIKKVDINDDGTVGIADTNLLLREFKIRNGD